MCRVFLVSYQHKAKMNDGQQAQPDSQHVVTVNQGENPPPNSGMFPQPQYGQPTAPYGSQPQATAGQGQLSHSVRQADPPQSSVVIINNSQRGDGPDNPTCLYIGAVFALFFPCVGCYIMCCFNCGKDLPEKESTAFLVLVWSFIHISKELIYSDTNIIILRGNYTQAICTVIGSLPWFIIWPLYLF